MDFIAPQLAKSIDEFPHAKMAGSGYVYEPKMDGERCGIVIAGGTTVAVYTRRGRMVLGEKAHAWMTSIDWPLADAYLDGEAYPGSGESQAQDVAANAKSTAGVPLSLALFDVLAIGGLSTLAEPFARRRELLEIAFSDWSAPRVALTPLGEDPKVMWDAWVEGCRGEGLIAKKLSAPYAPGKRSDAFLKMKIEMTVDVVVTGLTDKATYTRGGYRTGAFACTYGYYNPSTGVFITVGQGIKIGSREELEPLVGTVVEMRCAGVMGSGALRHHHLIRLRPDKSPMDCVKDAG